jgi:hypothetical protein
LYPAGAFGFRGPANALPAFCNDQETPLELERDDDREDCPKQGLENGIGAVSLSRPPALRIVTTAVCAAISLTLTGGEKFEVGCRSRSPMDAAQ